jgi:hypothetical protein
MGKRGVMAGKYQRVEADETPDGTQSATVRLQLFARLGVLERMFLASAPACARPSQVKLASQACKQLQGTTPPDNALFGCLPASLCRRIELQLPIASKLRVRLGVCSWTCAACTAPRAPPLCKARSRRRPACAALRSMSCWRAQASHSIPRSCSHRGSWRR